LTVVNIVNRTSDDAALLEIMRPTLLAEARKLVAILQGDAPAVTGNVLKFSARKS